MFYCIYCITNKINGKTYIGQHRTNNLNDDYMGSGVLLKQAYNKYGIENFVKSILAITGNKETMNLLEKIFIDLFWKENKCEYNLAPGGLGGFISEEVNEINRLAHLGKKQTIESNIKRSKTLMGHPSYIRTKEWRENHSKIMKGRKHTEETKRKISEIIKGKPSNTFGKHWKIVDGKRTYY